MTKERDDAVIAQRDVSDASTSLGEEMREVVTEVTEMVVTCMGTHPVQSIKYVGPLELFICKDPHCAHIAARCTHQVEIPKEEDSIPRKYTKSTCEWNTEGTILTCTFCGKDGT